MAVGFLLGAPIREISMFVVTLPFSIALAASEFSRTATFPGDGYMTALGYSQLLGALAVIALLMYAVGLLLALTLPANQLRSAGAGVVLMFMVPHMLWIFPVISHFTLLPTILSALNVNPREVIAGDFLGLRLPPFAIGMLHQVPLFILLFIAIVRKMRHDLAYPYPRLIAVVFVLLVAALMLGDLNSPPLISSGPALAFGPISMIYTLAFFCMILTSITTPPASDFTRGLRHARKLGERLVHPWSDYAANWPTVTLFAIILLAAVQLASLIVKDAPGSPIITFLLPAAIASCAIFTFGFLRQGFNLLYKKNSQTYFWLCIFLLWLTPILLRVVTTILEFDDDAGILIGAISPITAIGTIAADTYTANPDLVVAVAVISALLQAILAGGLCLYAVRKSTEEILATEECRPAARV